jgi:hypothetical protein
MGIASAVVGGIGAITKAVSGASEERKAREALANYRRQELRNVYEGVGVSTLGADLRREEAARLAATSIDALQASGTRGVLGGIGGVQQQSNLVNRQIAADLDEQQKQLDRLRAQDQARIRQIQEQREAEDLQGLGQQLQTGRQDFLSGIGDIAGVTGSIGRGITSGQFKNEINSIFGGPKVNAPATSIDLQPQGLQNLGGLNYLNPNI